MKNYEDGKLVDTDGSFEAGVDGALPGIVMQAHPAVGDADRNLGVNHDRNVVLHTRVRREMGSNR